MSRQRTYLFQALTTTTVFSFGSGEHGQLGNGRTGEHIITGNKTAYDVHNDPSESFVAPRCNELPLNVYIYPQSPLRRSTESV